MSAIPPVTSTPTTTPSKSSGLIASSDTFLKLLVANISHQDPMAPQDSSAYMQQLSSMTMVEQLTTLADTQTAAAREQRAATAIGLLGKTVTYINANGEQITGPVQRVEVSGTVPSLTIDGVGGITTTQINAVAS